MNKKLKEFYNEANMENEDDLLDIMQIARTVISKNGYLIAEIPFKDIEIELYVLVEMDQSMFY